jgi:hypothetical protein
VSLGEQMNRTIFPHAHSEDWLRHESGESARPAPMASPRAGRSTDAGTAGPVRVDGEETRQALLAEISRRKSRAAQLEAEMQQSVSPQSRGATAQTVFRARRDTLRALENYSEALRLRGWPTPPKMVNEIQLLRSLLGIRGTGVGT